MKGEQTTGLVRYDEMCRAIAAAYRVDEVKDIRDKARALEVYARQAKNADAEIRACQIRLRAERKAGQLLKVMARSKERAVRGRPEKSRAGRDLKITDLGISHDQSARWQKMAEVSDSQFESALANGKTTTAAIVELEAKPKAKPVDPRALWFCARLREIERDYLGYEPPVFWQSLTPMMRADVARILPRFSVWLERLTKESENAEEGTTQRRVTGFA